VKTHLWKKASNRLHGSHVKYKLKKLHEETSKCQAATFLSSSQIEKLQSKLDYLE